jgi:hypothetical protein
MRNRSNSALAALLALALGGCCHSESFKATEKGFAPSARGGDPVVFLDRLPREPYRTVGVIRVARPNSTPLGEFIDAARTHATMVGCDVVIDAFLVGATGSYCKKTPVYGAPNCCTRRFVCGAYSTEGLARGSSAPSDAPQGRP